MIVCKAPRAANAQTKTSIFPADCGLTLLDMQIAQKSPVEELFRCFRIYPA